MDKEVLKQRLTEQFQRSLQRALDAVDQAADGQWIADSEWQVRDIFQKLTTDCYEQLLQQRLAQLQKQAAFSPSGWGGVAPQRRPRRPRADGLR